MPEPTSHAIHVETLLAEYNRKLRLARATDLAKSGRFLEAEALLRSARGIVEGGKELDLLARIAVHRWRFREARLLWEAAARSEPENAEYRRCLDEIRARESKLRRSAKFALVTVLTLAFAALLSVGTFALVRRHNPLPTQQDGGVKAQKSP